jgi:hypothetical protein
MLPESLTEVERVKQEEETGEIKQEPMTTNQVF